MVAGTAWRFAAELQLRWDAAKGQGAGAQQAAEKGLNSNE